MMRQTCVRREWSETEMEECENDTQGETLKQSDEEKRYKLQASVTIYIQLR